MLPRACLATLSELGTVITAEPPVPASRPAISLLPSRAILSPHIWGKHVGSTPTSCPLGNPKVLGARWAAQRCLPERPPPRWQEPRGEGTTILSGHAPAPLWSHSASGQSNLS